METKKSRMKDAEHLRKWRKNVRILLTTSSLCAAMVLSACNGNHPSTPVGSKSTKKVSALKETKDFDSELTLNDREEDTLKKENIQSIQPSPKKKPSIPREPIYEPIPDPFPDPVPGPLPMPSPKRQLEDPIIDFPDLEAEFPGGGSEMIKWINENIKYPENYYGEKYGKIYVSFVVEKDGTLTNVNIERGVSIEMDREAKRLIRSMPKWTPGEAGGKVVRSRYRIPITINLQ